MITFWQFILMIGYKVEKHRNEGIKFTWKMPRVVAHFTRQLLDARPFNHLKARMEEEEVKWATIIAAHQILPRFKLFHLKASPFPLKIQQLQNSNHQALQTSVCLVSLYGVVMIFFVFFLEPYNINNDE